MPDWQYRVRVRLVRERVGRFRPTISCAGDIAELMIPQVANLDREQFIRLDLDAKNRLISREVVSIGHLTSALVHPREVFKAAILANASSVAFVHNHPSHDPEPSREDIELTRRLYRAGELLGIQVFDHVVIGGARFVSLADRGLA